MSPTEKSRKKRGELVDQVIAMLSRFDFKEATVRKICEVTGISVGTFYHYFHEKNDLVTEILKRIDVYLEAETPRFSAGGDEARNLMEFGCAFARYANGVGSAAGSVISTSNFPLPGTPEGMRAERGRPLYAMPAAIIRRGQAAGQFDPALDAEETAAQLVVALRGHSLEWARRGRPYDVEERIRAFLLLFVRALAPAGCAGGNSREAVDAAQGLPLRNER